MNKAGSSKAGDARQARLADALRANLKRRKAQARSRDAAADTGSPAPTGTQGDKAHGSMADGDEICGNAKPGDGTDRGHEGNKAGRG